MDVLRQGSVRMKSRRFGVYRRCWLMLKKASSKGPWRLERFADERSALFQGPLKVLELNAACFALRQCKDARKRSVAVSCLDGTVRIFSCDSEREAEAWCKVLSQGELGLTFGVGRGEPDLLVTGAQREQQERFPVILLPSSALDVSGACRLQIAPEHIHLWDSGDPLCRLLSWPLSSLRRYGRDTSHFTFEAGRSCHTGEGLFTFETPLGEQIYQHVHAATLAIAAQQQRCREQLEAQGQVTRKIATVYHMVLHWLFLRHCLLLPCDVTTPSAFLFLCSMTPPEIAVGLLFFSRTDIAEALVNCSTFPSSLV